MFYLKSCSLAGSLHSCIESKYYLDLAGCRRFRDKYKAKIVYPRLIDDLVELVLGGFLEDGS